MDEKIIQILQRIREHGDSPSAQALNLAELAGLVLDEHAGQEVAEVASQSPAAPVERTEQ